MKYNKNKLQKLIYSFIFIAITFTITACNNKSINNTTEINGIYFDTFINITLYGDAENELISEIKEKLSYYDNLLSEDKSDSDIYKINNNLITTVNDETLLLIKHSIELAEKSNGLIDPTIQTISEIYTFDQNEHELPAETEINNRIQYVNYKNITISGNKIIKDNKENKITLGFIAKGYIADRILDILKESKINGAIINLGGNILTYGNKPDNSSFKIAVEKPFDTSQPFITLDIKNNKSVVTSGIYERYFTNNDKIYHHILNTSTGYPIENNLYSVTIIGPSSETADSLSTLFLIMGYEKAEKELQNYPDYSAIYIFDDYMVKYSSNFNKTIIHN